MTNQSALYVCVISFIELFFLGAPANGGQTSERDCDSPPEPAPPEVPPRGPSLHVTLRHRPTPCDQSSEPDRLYLSEGMWTIQY